jgi:hypothetical protein
MCEMCAYLLIPKIISSYSRKIYIKVSCRVAVDPEVGPIVGLVFTWSFFNRGVTKLS